MYKKVLEAIALSQYNKCTCVKVNKEKMTLIKAKGLNLQDLLDNAMDNELQLNDNQINNGKIEQINEKIEKLEQEKLQTITDYQKKIDTLLKNLNELKKQEEEFYDKQIRILQLKKEYMEKNMEVE